MSKILGQEMPTFRDPFFQAQWNVDLARKARGRVFLSTPRYAHISARTIPTSPSG